MDTLRIGMIGCGTVGSGVLELLYRRREEFAQRADRPLEVARIVVRDLGRSRHHVARYVDSDVFTADVHAVTDDPSIGLVVEVAGGIDPPRDWIVRSLTNGKDVVTANKAAMAFHGTEIFRVAAERQRAVYYEASVAAAIPIIEMIRNGLVANQVTHLSAILNGTCNYILTRMEEDSTDYASALQSAQEKGFAEADPTLDVSGQDSAHKLNLLARLVTRADITTDDVYTEGVERIAREDIEFAASLNYRIKLLAIADRTDEGAWDLRVHPTMIRRDSLLAQVRNEYNAVYLRTDAAGPMLAFGNGAGSLPTASSVVADVVRAAKGDRPVHTLGGKTDVARVRIEDVILRHYIRMTVLDVPGVLGQITSLFGAKGISISSLLQPDAKAGRPVPVVVVTHEAVDSVVTETLSELEKVGLVQAPPIRIRIED